MRIWVAALLAMGLPGPVFAQADDTPAQWQASDAAMAAQWMRTFAYSQALLKALDAGDTTHGGGFG